MRVPTSTQRIIYTKLVQPLLQAEYLGSMVPTSTQVERKFPKKWRRVFLHGRLFVHCPNFDQNRNFFDPGLYTGGVFMLSSNLYTGWNEASKNGGAISFTDAFVHCPDFGSKSKFYRSRPSSYKSCGDNKGSKTFVFFHIYF
ncbi:hypothetical protein TNCV_4957591 [Trichonephila clavipes]|nr:hypothetical protein TNCV_4957591 [Trichonephila clavipes]